MVYKIQTSVLFMDSNNGGGRTADASDLGGLASFRIEKLKVLPSFTRFFRGIC